MTEEALFELAFHTPAAERPALLDRVCANHPALRARVEALLAADATLTPFVHSEGTRTFSADERATRTAHSPTTPDGDGSLLAGKYKLLERIGEGGMGSVWLAQLTEDTPTSRQQT